MSAMSAPDTHSPRILNRKARRDFTVLERFEAGLALLGTEVKSVREGRADLAGGFADLDGDNLVLRDVHITPYEVGHQFNHEPRRPRRLLLHRREIRRLVGQMALKGRTVVPLALYFNRHGRIKVELGLCQGKQAGDKRETLRRQTADRDAERALADRQRRGARRA